MSDLSIPFAEGIRKGATVYFKYLYEAEHQKHENLSDRYINLEKAGLLHISYLP